MNDKPATNSIKRLYSIAETIETTGLGRSTIYGLISEGKIKSIKIGKRRLISVDAINDFISRHSERDQA